MSEKTLYIIDGQSQLYKGYYAIRRLSNSKGFPTNAIYGFLQMFNRMVRELDPHYVLVTFDCAAPTFRSDIYPEYKANRPAPPDDLIQQIPVLKDILKAMRLPCMEKEGFEADDIIGTVAERAKAEAFKVVILSSDKDLFQLVSDNVQTLRIHGDQMIFYDSDRVEKEMGVPPEKIVDLLAIMGDNVDNIPGIPGFGPKTAAKILAQVDSAEQAVNEPDRIAEEKYRAKLREHRDSVLLSRKLATIDRNTPVDVSFETFRWSPPDPPPEDLIALYRELEFNGYLKAIEANNGNSTTRAVTYSTITGVADLENFVARAKESQILAVDTETTSSSAMEADLVGISMSIVPGEAVYIPVGHDPFQTPEQIPLVDVKNVISSLLKSSVPKCGHNIKYDLEVMRRHGFDVRNVASDSMIAAYLLDPDKRAFGLKSLALEKLDISMTGIDELIGKGKHQITMAEVDVERAGPYACADADVTLQLTALLEKQLEANQLDEIYRTMEVPLIEVLTDMEMTGVRIDTGHLKTLSEQFSRKTDELAEEIYGLVGKTFNINSPKQVAAILFEDLNLKPTKTGKGGSFSTDVSVLEALSDEHPLPKLLLEYRAIEKLKSTYVDALPALINPRTHRIHTSYNQSAVATGRLSSSDPNLQNIPVRTEQGREIRRAFIPSSNDYLLLAADYSQIELRILAHLSGDSGLIEAFKHNEDIHTATAVKLFGVEAADVSREMRSRAKVVNFGVLYGMSANRLSREFGINRKEAQQVIDDYFASFPNVREWMDRVLSDARKNGYVTTLAGRRRYIPNINSSSRMLEQNAERIAINTPVQGTSADMIKKAMIAIHREIQKAGLKAKMVLQVHDELIFDTPKNEVEGLSSLVTRLMENALPLDVPVKVDLKIGANWAEC